MAFLVCGCGSGHYKSTIGADFLSSEVTIQDKVVTLQVQHTGTFQVITVVAVLALTGA